jgi:hypothetical protein
LSGLSRDSKGFSGKHKMDLTGNIYLDLDMGVKGGLNDVAPDYSVLAGLTLSF